VEGLEDLDAHVRTVVPQQRQEQPQQVVVRVLLPQQRSQAQQALRYRYPDQLVVIIDHEFDDGYDLLDDVVDFQVRDDGAQVDGGHHFELLIGGVPPSPSRP
jgi:hypothetical protein